MLYEKKILGENHFHPAVGRFGLHLAGVRPFAAKKAVSRNLHLGFASPSGSEVSRTSDFHRVQRFRDFQISTSRFSGFASSSGSEVSQVHRVQRFRGSDWGFKNSIG